jgi:adenine-specific DNA-methyltransferase
MSQKYEKLKNLLRELFQLDQPDLDFGLYRIMHAKSAEVTQFLDKDLLPQVKQAFSLYKTADKAELYKELAKAIEQAQALGADPESLPKVKELRAKIATEAVDVGALENEVYDHLYSFFRRYYSEGDFLAKRVYKPGVYAIPYEGEEVKLQWANKDQYYIKTSEYLRDYAFRLRPEDDANSMRVHFRLVEVAEGEHGNVKAVEGKERVFILAPKGDSGRDFLTLANGEAGQELVIHFEYRPANLGDWPEVTREGKTKPPSQKELLSFAAEGILGTSDVSLATWLKELSKNHLTASGQKADYNRLEAHLRRYSGRNTFDYFIHKDLGGFLRRELDFFIKNEVMHLDDVENETAPRVEQFLSKVKVIRVIAKKVIDFLSQLEDFQKKLWLKKKFVVETTYCITLGHVPTSFYPEICANVEQCQEWVHLYAIDEISETLTQPRYTAPLTQAFLKANPLLMLDTRHFSTEFTHRLLASLGDLNEAIDGIVLHSENFQGMRLIEARYKSSVDVIYIDPPYNTDASAILYKNDYKHSSWISLMQDRLLLASSVLEPSGVICVAIDDEEVSQIRFLLAEIFPKRLGVAVVRSNPQSRKAKGTFSPVHEYALFFGGNVAKPGSLELTDKRLARYPKEDEKGRYAWMNFIRTGNNDRRADRPKLYYPIYVNQDDSLRIPSMTWEGDDKNGAYVVHDAPTPSESVVWPTAENDGGLIEKNWHRGHPRVAQEPEEYRVRRDSTGKISIDFKTRIDEDSMPTTWWDNNEYASANYGAAELKALFGEKPFDFPKAQSLVTDCLRASNCQTESVVVDYFAGSGTTAHAVISLNRADGGKRKFVLVEGGAHCDSVVIPRIKKAAYSTNWADGKPNPSSASQQAEHGPRVVKILRLESYEDSFNNLEIRRTTSQQSLLDSQSGTPSSLQLKEDYVLRYMLDVEARDSQSLLNIRAFADPTAYVLKIKLPGTDESRSVTVDLIETFNWLIGLAVQNIAPPQTFNASFERDEEQRLRIKGKLAQSSDGQWWFRRVEGTTKDGRKTLIVWRKLTGDIEKDNLALDSWMTDRLKISTKDFEFDLIYVNGDNNLENLKLPDDTWKVRLIEEDFHRLMFDTEGI